MQAIIFDFDGVILDTELPEFEGWLAVYRHYGGELTAQDWSACIGSNFDRFDPHTHLAQQIGRPVDRAQVKAIRHKRFWELMEGQDLLPGVAGYIEGTKKLGLKLGLASSSSRAWVTRHLERFALVASFDCLCCSDDVAHVKPDPELYRIALAALDVEPGRAIALEDSPNGVLAANRAGLFTVAVPNALTAALPLDHADLKLGSLAEMPLEELIARARRSAG